MIVFKVYTIMYLIPFIVLSQTDNTKKVYSSEEINESIKKISQGNNKELDNLISISLGNHPITMTQDLVKIVIFGLIRTNQMNKLSDYIKKIDPGLTSFLKDRNINNECKECEAKGKIETKCHSCVFGKCYNCKGEGYIKYKGIKGFKEAKNSKGEEKKDSDDKSICNTCHGTGKCLKCKGEGNLKKDCPHCQQGMTLNKNIILSEMLKSIQNISKEVNSSIASNQVNEIAKKQELENLFNKSVNKSIKDVDDNNVNNIENSDIYKAFTKTKKYIEDTQVKKNINICKDISLKLIDNVPTLILEISNEYYQNINSIKVREILGFKQYWEDQAIIHGYERDVGTLMMNNGVNISGKFKINEKYKREIIE